VKPLWIVPPIPAHELIAHQNTVTLDSVKGMPVAEKTSAGAWRSVAEETFDSERNAVTSRDLLTCNMTSLKSSETLLGERKWIWVVMQRAGRV
jgi:hypothetical protein